MIFVHYYSSFIWQSFAYKDGFNHIWIVEDNQLDSLDEINLGKLEFEDLSLDKHKLETVMFVISNKNEIDVINLWFVVMNLIFS